MRISKKTQYGLRAMVYLGLVYKKDRKTISSLKEISKKENISFDYLEKIISELEKKGFVKAKRGIKGGYFLAVRPERIRVVQIFQALEGDMALVQCIAKTKGKRYKCPRRKICKTVNVWQRIQDVLQNTLYSITLADLIKNN